jgi:hypothetical protein
MSDTQQDIWLSFHIFQAKMEKKYTPKLQKILKAQADTFNAYAAAHGFNMALSKLHDIVTGADFLPIINEIHYNSAAGYGGIEYRRLKLIKGTLFNVHVIIGKAVVKLLQMSLINNCNGIADSIKNDIIRIIEQGNVNGWGYDKTANKIKDIVNSKSRALRIVRTESVKGSNMGAMEAAKLTGLVMDKVWLSARDNRVRGNPTGKYPVSPSQPFDHWDMNGTTQGIDKPFLVSGNELQFPGDPKGEPGNIINCRCCVSFKPKRDENGRAIRIRDTQASGINTPSFV